MSTNYSKRRRALVNGYIRNIEAEYEIVNIPKEIHDIIYLYQMQYDEWDKETSHPNAIIENNGTRILFSAQLEDSVFMNATTAFGKQIISDGVFSWRVKIISLKAEIDDASPYIGIIKHSKENVNSFKTRGSWQKIGFQLCAGNSGLWCECIYGEVAPDDNGKSYSCYWNKDGDIIEMILDLEEGTLRYILNDEDCGIAFCNIKQGEYRLAMTCLQPHASFEFL